MIVLNEVPSYLSDIEYGVFDPIEIVIMLRLYID
jgi:hypothetical protein